MSVEKLKAAALADKGRHKIVETESGLKFEIREPTVGDKGRYAEALQPATTEEGMEPTAVIQEIMKLTVRCVYDPESGQRVFSDDEVGLLIESRIGDMLSDEVQKLMQGSKGETGKESEETPSSADVSSLEKP